MQKTYEVKGPLSNRCLLVTISLYEDRQKGWSPEDSSAEFEELALSSGAKVLGHIVVRLDEPTANLFLGKGKIEEIHTMVESFGSGIDSVIFSENLSSTQQRNIEHALGVKVIDRTQLILDIFSQRAHTNEGKLQVELARLEYMLPRLSGLGVKLSRLGGGIGTRGPGEQMLETDRRGIMRKIKYAKSELAKLSKRRKKLRQNRMEHSVATVAVIGYTNAGKSTLINKLTGSDVLSDNRLFCTLDLTAHRLVLPNNQKILLVDTVGFIHKLPHNLIEAFKATLEEVKEADLLLHVLDISSPKAGEHLEAVMGVLKEIDSYEKPIITALNKIDLVSDNFEAGHFRRNIEDSVLISAKEGTSLKTLVDMIKSRMTMLVEKIDILIPHDKMGLLSSIYEQGRVLERKDVPEGIRIKAVVPHHLKAKLKA
ncbi:MAG: GTPase HflX [Candidatus Omnitrophica bacterium]|jgi:GTP-binding protein HflX|nr:GTPase HflX [Candidatus Omnitrophota bacterium]